jgi:hypothetical protein
MLSQVAQSNPADASGPTDDEIVSLVKVRLKQDALDGVANQYGDLDKLNAKDALSELQALAPATAQPLLACTLNAPQEESACMNKVKSELLAERAANIKNIQNADVDSQFAFSIQEKTNYEGNYVVRVNLRERGSDKSWQWKLLVHPKNGSWVITEKEEKEID